MYELVIRSSVRVYNHKRGVYKQSEGGVARWERGHAVHSLKPSLSATVDDELGGQQMGIKDLRRLNST